MKVRKYGDHSLRNELSDVVMDGLPDCCPELRTFLNSNKFTIMLDALISTVEEHVKENVENITK